MDIRTITIAVFLIILVSIQFTLNKILMEIRIIRRYLGRDLHNKDGREG